METTFEAMDLVQAPGGELFVAQQKKPDASGLYWAISLKRPQMNILDVSDEECEGFAHSRNYPRRFEPWLTGKRHATKVAGGSVFT
jgi:hypothetical protein